MAYLKQETAAEHDYAHALVAGAGLALLAAVLAAAAAYAQVAALLEWLT